MTIGRDPRRSDLVLFNPSVSQKHCQVVVDDEECTLIDVGSSNGTFVNGERLSSSRILRQGDLITIGRFVFVFLWFRFAPTAQPEMLHYDGLRATFARLYPTPASIQTLLLASNLFSLPVDITRGTIDQIWERVLSGLKRQDFFPSLRNLTHASLREHPDSSELLRLQATLAHWDAMRQERGVQERVNIDVKNSMLLVREILGHHSSAEEEAETPAQMDLDDAEPLSATPRAPGGLAPLADARNGVRPSLLPPDLPFELKPDENTFKVPTQTAVAPVSADGVRNTAGSTTAKSEGLSLPPLAAPMAANATTPKVESPAASTAATSPAPSAASTPVETASPAPIQTPPLPAATMSATPQDAKPKPAATSSAVEDAVAPAAPLSHMELDDPLMPPPPSSMPRRAEGKAEPPPPVPLSSRTDLAGESLAGAPDGTGAASNGAPWEQEPAPTSTRPRWLMPVAAAALLGLGAYLLQSLFSDPTEQMAAAPDKVEEGASTDSKSAGSTGEGTGEGNATSASPTDAASKTGETQPADAKGSETAAAAGEAGAKPTETTGAAGAKPTESAGAATEPTPGVPVKPGFYVINFLGEDEKPKYTKETSPAGAGWDDKTSQIPAPNLKDCQWVGNRTAVFQSKGGKTFRFVQCTTGKALVEGWVVEAGMKNK